MNARRRSNPPDDADNPSLEEIGGDEIRDDEGLLVDEYSSEAFDDPDALDVLDIPAALEDDSVLEDVADDSNGIEEVSRTTGEQMDTVDTGARRAPTDDVDMGFGAEPHSTDELADAALGTDLKGRAAVTRDDQVHGERLLDSPDDPE
jgi:hypothetical protein